MCDYLPDVNKCCMCGSVRVGIIFIGVLALCTGSLTAMAVQKNRGTNLTSFKNLVNDPGGKLNFTFDKVLKERQQATRALNALVPHSLMIMSALFIMGGTLCFYSTLFDSQCLINLAVICLVLAMIGGLGICLGITVECIFEAEKCLLRDMDWVSGGIFIILSTIYLISWIYYIAVCNTYALDTQGS